MAGILDLLKKAAGAGDEPPSAKPQGNQDAGVDMGKLAQDSADSAKAAQYKGAPYPKTPSSLSTTMTPQAPNGGTKGK